MGIKFANNATTTLAGSITAAATSLTVATSTGGVFPALGGSDYFFATLASGTTKIEIIKVTARSGDVLTIVRAQDGTTAQTFSAGDVIEMRPVAGIFTDATLLSSTQVTTALGYTPLAPSTIGSTVQAWDADLDAIAALAGTSGFLKKTAANTWSLDTSTYLTGNQTITFTGDATGSGATSVALTLATVNANIGTFNNVTVNAKGLVTAASNVAYLTGNQTITFTGDATGSGATSVALTLANSGVTAGTYTKVTVDAKGRVTTGASLASTDLPTYTGTLTSLQVTTALGYTPYNSTNPSGYITSSGSISGSAGSVANDVTFNNAGTGAASGTTFNGSAAQTISYNTIGAAAASHTQAWSTITGTPTTLSGYGISDAVGTTGTQTIDGVKTFRGAASTDAYMYLSAVNGIAVFQIAGSATNSAFLLFANSTNNERSRITVTDARGFYISNNSGTTNHLTLDASGNLTLTGNVVANSDERLKKDWTTLSADFVYRLAQVKHGTYTRIDTGERQAGTSAQAFKELLPEVVMASEDGTLSLAYGNAALVSAIQLAQQLVHTQNRLDQLEAKLAKIAAEG